MTESLSPTAVIGNGTKAARIAVLVVSFFLSGYGVIAPLLFLSGTSGPTPGWVYGWSATITYGWIAWIVMGVFWVRNKRLGWFWPVTGTIAGVLSMLPTVGFGILFVSPAVAMAIVLVIFHLGSDGAQRTQ